MSGAVKDSIKSTLRIINKALKQVPSDKRILLTSRINDVLSKYQSNMNENEALQKFSKELSFNLNFIKLSHPTLDYNPDPQINNEEQHKVNLVNDDFQEFERLKDDTFDNQEERQKNVRQQVMFSNWFQGNADPEQLNRHKELLQRQHFSGDFWKDKEKPRSSTKEYLKSVLASGKPMETPKKDKQLKDAKPKNIQQNEQFWEKVKR